jgi:hypothetical protein
MMQLSINPDILLIIFFESFIALMMFISIGIIRYSRNLRYKLWSIGWIVFTLSASSMTLATGESLLWSDGIGLSGMILSPLILLDGLHERTRKKRELLLYPSIVFLGFAILFVGMLLQLQYAFVFTIPGMFNTYACWSCARQVQKKEISPSAESLILFLGFVVLGLSTLLYPFTIFEGMDIIITISVSSGLILLGSGMLAYFIRKTSEELTVQYQISQLMSGIINHDIRNYVSSLGSCIEYARESESERASWLDYASEIITSVEEFIANMRQIQATTTRFRAERDSLVLLDMLSEVSTRVEREYNQAKGCIVIEVPADLTVLTSKIAKELLWNISDNAFKQGSKILVFKIQDRTNEIATLVISDNAGGMPYEVREFLNNPKTFSSSIAPGMGLGIILIRGLSLLCDIKMKVDDNISESGVVGTVYNLTFDCQIHDNILT